MPDSGAPELSAELASLPWLRDMLEQGWQPVHPTAELLSRAHDNVDTSNNLMLAFLEFGLLRDFGVLFHLQERRYCAIAKLGSYVCGHPGIVHGGFTAAIMDDTFGALVYALKQEGMIDAGAMYTVHLEADYKKPVPAASTVCCTTSIRSIEGRKTWADAIVEDKPGGTTFATGAALFVIAKKGSEAAAKGFHGGPKTKQAKETAFAVAAAGEANGNAR